MTFEEIQELVKKDEGVNGELNGELNPSQKATLKFIMEHEVCADENRHGHEGHPPNQSHSVGAFRHLRAPLCAKEYVIDRIETQGQAPGLGY